MLEVIQDKRDVEDLVAGLLDDEDDEEGDEDEDDLEEEAEEETEENVLEESHGRPEHIEAYWDTSDPNNVGWAYRTHYPGGHQESGEIEGRRDLSDSTLTSRARAAAGFPGTRIPVKIR